MSSSIDELALTKTDKVLRVVIGIFQACNMIVSEEQLFVLLGNPSRAQKYKLLSELLSEKLYRPPILNKDMKNGVVFYSIDRDFYQLFLKN